MMNEYTVLNAANYEELCDYSIVPPYGNFFLPEILNRDCTIFCKTDFTDYLFDNIKTSKFNYKLITHHSDYSIDEERFTKKPPCIKKWFAINVAHKHPDLISIPLGLKTHKGCYLEPQYMTKWFCSQITKLQNNKKDFKVYCNWNSTNIIRNNIVKELKNNNICYTHEHNKPFNQYIENMSRHAFVLSPPGNGIDCHRTWEALYVGSIPIVIKNSIYDNWLNLPILQVSSFNDITENLLRDFLKNQFKMEQLSINFWKILINE